MSVPIEHMSSVSVLVSSRFRPFWLIAFLLFAAGCDALGLFGGGGRIYSGGNSFGNAVALDGDRAIVGAPGSDDAFVLRRASEWDTEVHLQPPDGLPDDERSTDAYFGLDVDVDGPIVVVGAPVLGVITPDDPGRAFVFEHAGGRWARTADLRAADPSQNRPFGRSVAASGSRVAVLEGAAVERITANLIEPAAVVFYERSAMGWSEASLIEEESYERPTGAGGASLFGLGLALDGGRVAIGSPGQDVGGVRGAGAVRLYERAGAGWSLAALLSPPSLRENDAMGTAVALDGPIAATVAPGRDIEGALTGSAFVFRESGSEWAFEAELRPADITSQDFYGSSIDASGDRVVVGARSRAQFRGSVFVWVRLPSGEWDLEAELWPEGSSRASFGESVALDGDQLLVGANTDRNGKGAVYAFRRGPEGWVQQGR